MFLSIGGSESVSLVYNCFIQMYTLLSQLLIIKDKLRSKKHFPVVVYSMQELRTHVCKVHNSLETVTTCKELESDKLQSPLNCFLENQSTLMKMESYVANSAFCENGTSFQFFRINQGILSLELSSYVLEIPNGAYTTQV